MGQDRQRPQLLELIAHWTHKKPKMVTLRGVFIKNVDNILVLNDIINL